MKTKLLLTITLAIFSWNVNAQEKCGTMKHWEFIKSKDPDAAKRMQQLEEKTQERIKNFAVQKKKQIITIPVVVHVLWNDPIEDISNAQIQSQIDILNEDFRLLNSDSLTDTHPFYYDTDDAEIEFCLAVRDEYGDTTTGITRTYTNSITFIGDGNEKHTATGGKDNWDPTKYLNLWVCNLDGSGGTLGYATFPSDLTTYPDLDGVVIRYEAFGDIGTAGSGSFATNDLGRTATHEVGHWLNLLHIWGDDICGDDFVSDTPEHEDANYNCPAFPHKPFNACIPGTGADGEMYMNYMDYVDDNCMVMFTMGQADRMWDALDIVRDSLFTSRGCLPCTLIPGFTASSTNICKGETVTFTNTSTGAPTYYEWDEDGTTFSTSINASRTFNTADTYVIDLWAYDQYNECGDFTSTTITVNVCSGINEPLTNNNIQIYPNPSYGEFTLEMNIPKSQKIQIEITNVLGQIIYIENLKSFKGIYQKQVNLREFSNGIYTAKISTDQGIVVKKLILNK